MEKLWLKHYPPEIPAELPSYPYTSIKELFDEVFQKYSKRTAFVSFDQELTYEKLDTLSTHFASFLQNELKLEKGDRVALQMPNVMSYPVALFGVLKAGLIVVNTNPLYTVREMKYQFQDSGIKAVVIFSPFAKKLESLSKELNLKAVVTVDPGELLNLPKALLVNFVAKYIKKMIPSYHFAKSYTFQKALDLGSQKTLQDIKVNLDDLAAIQYTGGTTGVSKGAMLTQKNILSNLFQMYYWIKPFLKNSSQQEEIVITPLPLYHAFAFTVNALALTYLGFKNVLVTNPRNVSSFIKDLKKHKVTIFTGIQTLFNLLMKHPEFKKIDFSSLKITLAGGMALQKITAEKWEKITGCRISEGYGLTETSPVACVNLLGSQARYNTIGIPVSSTTFQIRDDQDKALPVGKEGELCIHGPQIMKGYWNRQEATDEIIKDSWLKTGDIAVQTEDGYFKIVDRKKDMILVSGFNVYPNEIEEVLTKHDKIFECGAIGVADPKSGETVKVFIVLHENQKMSKEEVLTYCRENLTSYKIPRHIEFREEPLPKSPIGKVLRKKLK